MKKWEKPELEVLGVELTMNGHVSGDREQQLCTNINGVWVISETASSMSITVKS